MTEKKIKVVTVDADGVVKSEVEAPAPKKKAGRDLGMTPADVNKAIADARTRK